MNVDQWSTIDHVLSCQADCHCGLAPTHRTNATLPPIHEVQTTQNQASCGAEEARRLGPRWPPPTMLSKQGLLINGETAFGLGSDPVVWCSSHTGRHGLLLASQGHRTRPNLFIWFSGALEPLGCSLRAKARGRDRHLPVNQLCKGKDDNGAATPSVHLIHPLSTDGMEQTLVVKVYVRGLYIAMGQYSSFCVSAVVLTLGSDDIEDGVPGREQVECGREEVNDGEKQERGTERGSNQRTIKHTSWMT